MGNQGLEAIVERLGQAKLLVLGDLRLEQVLRGAAARDAQGVLKVSVSDRVLQAGGAGGVACAAAAIGAQVCAAGVLGQDARSGDLLRALAQAGVDAFGAVSAPGSATAESLVVEFDPKGSLPWSGIEIDISPPPPLAGAPAQEMLAHIEALFGRVDVVTIITPQAAAQDALSRAAEFARGRGKPIVGGHIHGWLPPCDLVVLRAPGAVEGAAGEDQSENDPRRLMEEMGHKAVMAPCVGPGFALYRAGAAESEFVAARGECNSRAWDYLLAGAAAAVAVGAEPLAAGRIGAAAAAAVTAQQPITPDAIKRELTNL